MTPITNVQVQLTGEDGNVFSIIGRVSKAMRRAGVDNLTINTYMKDVMASDYDNAIRVTMAYVDVT